MNGEYGIFESLFTEGEQAEAYKKRKAAEQKAETKKGANRAMRKSMSYGFDQKTGDQVSADDAAGKMAKRMVKYGNNNSLMSDAEYVASDRKADNPSNKKAQRLSYALDAIDHHERRHPTKESAYNLFKNLGLV